MHTCQKDVLRKIDISSFEANKRQQSVVETIFWLCLDHACKQVKVNITGL
jgi:hypothetical protein